MQKTKFETGETPRSEYVLRARMNEAQLLEAQARESRGAGHVASAALMMDGEAFAGVHSVAWMRKKFFPEQGGAGVIALAHGKKSKFASSLRLEFRGEAGEQRMLAGGSCSRVLTASIQEAREAEKIERLFRRYGVRLAIGQHGGNSGEKSGESAQVHLVVTNDAGERLGNAAAKIVKVDLRNESGVHIIFAMPTEAGRIEDAALKLDETNGAEAEPPDGARGMQEVEMGGEARGANRAGHGEAIFEKRPVEGFAIEGDEDGALRDAGGELVEE